MENDMKKLVTIALLCGALLLSGCGAGEGAEYSLENMIRVEPQLKCGHPMENEYVEVVAKCRVKLSSELTAEGGREQV